jgi:hypothetical protein
MEHASGIFWDGALLSRCVFLVAHPAKVTFDADQKPKSEQAKKRTRRQSRAIADAWGKAGVATRYEEIAGTNHFTVLGPLTDPRSPMVARLVALAEKLG